MLADETAAADFLGLAPSPERFYGIRHGSVKADITIERLLQWAYGPGRPDGRAWIVDRSLSLDGGLTVRPRRRERGSWLLVEACAGLRLKQTAIVRVLGTTDRDAEMVAAVVSGLPRVQAEALRRYARGRSRPDWLDTVTRWEAVRREDGRGVVSWVANGRHRKVPWCALRCEMERWVTAASKERWRLWRAGLVTVADRLCELERWQLTDALPPEAPWQ